MAGKSPVKEAASSDSTINPKRLQIFTKFISSLVKSEIPSTPIVRLPPSQPSSFDVDVIHVPSYSHTLVYSCEVCFLPEFFDARSPSKSPNLYMDYKNSIIKHSGKILPRRLPSLAPGGLLWVTLVPFEGFSTYLSCGGLSIISPPPFPRSPLKILPITINQQIPFLLNLFLLPLPPKSFLLLGDSAALASLYVPLLVSFATRCYVRGIFRVGLGNVDFRRVEITDETKVDWSGKETLLLLEALMYYGDDWKKAAQHVGGRTEKDCVAHFVKLPFGEEFLGDPYSNEVQSGFETNKRMRLTPLADASNPIIAQAAFLSALSDVEVAEAAAQAAVTTLSEVDDTKASKAGGGSVSRNTRRDVKSLLEKEEGNTERAIGVITEVQLHEMLGGDECIGC